MRKSTSSPEIHQDLNASGARIIQVRSRVNDSPEATQVGSPSPEERRAAGALSGRLGASADGAGLKDLTGGGSGEWIGEYLF
jgi:hypothetical protein